MEKEILLKNIDKIRTTKMGVDRIRKNLKIENDVVEFCKEMIRNSNIIYKRGKNYYIEKDTILVTINSTSYTIIIAHMIKKGK